jgi:hypothetical protein
MISAKKPIEIQSNFIFNVPGKNLEDDNIVFLVKRIIHRFLEEYEFLLENEEKPLGRHKDYKIHELLGFIVLGVLNNKTSYRKLEEWAKNNDETCNYILNNKRPSKSTIGNFWNENIITINFLFEYVVKWGIEEGLIGFEHVAIDGTILKANASVRKIIRFNELIYLEKLIDNFYLKEKNENILFKVQKYYLGGILDESNEILIDSIEKNLNNEGIKLLVNSLYGHDSKEVVLKFISFLKKNYGGKNSISVTDPECNWMPNKSGVMGLNYNYQVATDDKCGFIVAQSLVNDPTDHHQLVPMIESVKMNLNRHPNYYTADNGYLTISAVEYLFKHNIKAILPDRYESSKIKNKTETNKFKKSNFEYNRINDTYICPNKEILKYKNNRKINNVLNKVYSTDKCKNCSDIKDCTKNNRREIFDVAHPLRIKMKEDYNSDFGQAIYKKRFHTGEVNFAILKKSRKFEGIQRTTIKKAQTELTLQAIVHNIKIIHKHITK